MAHNINEGKRMMYVGQKPWHGLGTELDKPATSKEAIEAAQLDYPLELQEIYCNNGKEIKGRKAVVRTDNGSPLGIVSDRYKVIQNVDAFSFFDVVVGEKLAIYNTAGALGDGERIWILAKLPDQLILTKEDVVDKYLLLVNTHDGTGALKMFFTPVRVVCQNTLTMSMSRSAMAEGISIRHTGEIKNKIEEARRVLGLASQFYADFDQQAARLVEYKMKPKQAEEFFTGLVFVKKNGKERDKDSTRLMNKRNELLTLFESGKGNALPQVKHSAWAALNAVTEWVDHHKGVRGEKEEGNRRLDNIWLGNGANFKRRAFDEVLELVGIRK